MKTTLVAAPANPVVDVAFMKEHLLIDHDLDDYYIESLISSAILTVENITNRRLSLSTWKAYADEWPTDYFKIPYGQLRSVARVTYKNSGGDEVTLDPDTYIVDVESDPGRVMLGYGKSWPSVPLYPSNPICIEFTCGYEDVPWPLKVAVMMTATDLYQNRGSVMVAGGTVRLVEIPQHIMGLLWSYRLFP